VIVPDQEESKILSFGTLEALAAELVKHEKRRELQAYVIFGVLVPFTEEPKRYLLHPNGAQVPLFSEEPLPVVQRDHRFGPKGEPEKTVTLPRRLRVVTPDTDEEEGHIIDVESEEPELEEPEAEDEEGDEEQN
jgi:hypothetical protein